jgi:O-antigen ligase
MEVHNTYLQVLCEQGIIGFIIYIIPVIYCLIYTIKKYRRTSFKSYIQLSIGIQLMYVIYGLTGNCNMGAMLNIYFIAVAIVVCVESIEHSCYHSDNLIGKTQSDIILVNNHLK